MVKMAASDDDSRSEMSEILADRCNDNTSPKKKDLDQNSETSSDPFEVRTTLFFEVFFSQMMFFVAEL